MAEYNSQKAEAEKVLHDLQDKRAARLSRKELLEGLIRTMNREGIVTDTFDGKLWLLLVEKATLGTYGKLTFTLRNGTWRLKHKYILGAVATDVIFLTRCPRPYFLFRYKSQR